VPGAVDKSKAQALLPSPARRHPGARETCPVASTQKTRRDWPRPAARPLARHVSLASRQPRQPGPVRYDDQRAGGRDVALHRPPAQPRRKPGFSRIPRSGRAAGSRRGEMSPHHTPTIQAISASLQPFFFCLANPGPQQAPVKSGTWALGMLYTRTLGRHALMGREIGRIAFPSAPSLLHHRRRSRRSGVDSSGKVETTRRAALRSPKGPSPVCLPAFFDHPPSVCGKGARSAAPAPSLTRPGVRVILGPSGRWAPPLICLLKHRSPFMRLLPCP
jgi:hypothetical protein